MFRTLRTLYHWQLRRQAARLMSDAYKTMSLSEISQVVNFHAAIARRGDYCPHWSTLVYPVLAKDCWGCR